MWGLLTSPRPKGLGFFVSHDLVNEWKYVADKISEIVKIPVYIIPD